MGHPDGNEYERMRQERVARNRSMMKGLGVDSAADELRGVMKEAEASPQKKKGYSQGLKAKQCAETPRAQKRQSQRIKDLPKPVYFAPATPTHIPKPSGVLYMNAAQHNPATSTPDSPAWDPTKRSNAVAEAGTVAAAASPGGSGNVETITLKKTSTRCPQHGQLMRSSTLGSTPLRPLKDMCGPFLRVVPTKSYNMEHLYLYVPRACRKVGEKASGTTAKRTRSRVGGAALLAKLWETAGIPVPGCTEGA